jgi:hypothetical protein
VNIRESPHVTPENRPPALVTPADGQDRGGGLILLATLFGQFPFLKELFADSACAGPVFHDGLANIMPNLATEIVRRSDRIDATGGGFASEGFYIRPTNGRAEDQVRRNHSTQHFSYPGNDFDRLRREAPGQYKSYADLVPGEWTHLRLEVSGAAARFFVGTAPQPVLVVHDLKRGPHVHGTVGLWVDSGTDGHFRSLSVHAR